MTDLLDDQAEMLLTNHGVYVDDVSESSDSCELRYESAAVDANDVIPHKEVGRVINIFRDLHDSTWEGMDISAVVTDFDGNERGQWRVEQEWLDRLHNGDLSEVEFSEKVIQTIEYEDG